MLTKCFSLTQEWYTRQLKISGNTIVHHRVLLSFFFVCASPLPFLCNHLKISLLPKERDILENFWTLQVTYLSEVSSFVFYNRGQASQFNFLVESDWLRPSSPIQVRDIGRKNLAKLIRILYWCTSISKQPSVPRPVAFYYIKYPFKWTTIRKTCVKLRKWCIQVVKELKVMVITTVI